MNQIDQEIQREKTLDELNGRVNTVNRVQNPNVRPRINPRVLLNQMARTFNLATLLTML